MVAAVIASRLGLRLVPFAIDTLPAGDLSAKERLQIVRAFRYAAIGYLATKHPSAALDQLTTIINSVAPSRTNFAGAAITEASFSGVSLFGAARGDFYTDAPSSRACYAAGIASAIQEAGSPWFAIAEDAAWIDKFDDPHKLRAEPIWLTEGTSASMPQPYLSRWISMCASLARDDDSWKVWTGWYQDRLDGAIPEKDEIEYLRLSLVPDAAAKANDDSEEGQQNWQREIEANSTIFKNDPRKANRLAARYIADFRSS